MMRHPFHGVIGPDSAESPVPESPTSQPLQELPSRAVGRRGFFGQALAAVAGAGAFLLARPAPAQTGWDAGGGIGFPEGPALQGGYGGGLAPRPSGQTVTTFAVGEEGGYYPQPRWPRPGRVTTYALGEEGGYYYRRPRYTTYALGEEGGGWSRRW